MLWNKYVLFIFLTLLSMYYSNSLKCVDFKNSVMNDNELLHLFKSNIDTLIDNNEYSVCIDSLLSSSFYNTLTYYLEQLALRKIKFRDSLKKSVNTLDNQMKELYNKYRFTEDDFQKVTPVIQWAQNLNHVFIQLKFSHRHDSPGCPEVENLQIDLTPKVLYLTSYCIQADVPIKFELKLPFFVEVNVEETKHTHDSNGRYVFTLPKAKGGMYWDRLVPEVSDYPRNTKLWLDMHEKHKKEIEQFIKDDEEEEYQKVLEEIGKKKKKGGRKKKVKFN